jgi:hypothetical protein
MTGLELVSAGNTGLELAPAVAFVPASAAGAALTGAGAGVPAAAWGVSDPAAALEFVFVVSAMLDGVRLAIPQHKII